MMRILYFYMFWRNPALFSDSGNRMPSAALCINMQRVCRPGLFRVIMPPLWKCYENGAAEPSIMNVFFSVPVIKVNNVVHFTEGSGIDWREKRNIMKEHNAAAKADGCPLFTIP